MSELSADVRRLLDRPNYAHVATLLPDGAPHVWVYLEGDNVAILTGPDSRKSRNLERDPRVAISVIDLDQPYASVLIRGRLVERSTATEAGQSSTGYPASTQASPIHCGAAESSY
jgi:nitroimidazol reductase NimA-like FMN-containing flavoprotein (pyridoxamine 5'-phosphate oxidase superfamily)